ncbi:MAG: HAD-IA family hydrolase, partial [Gaiellales bacterium]
MRDGVAEAVLLDYSGTIFDDRDVLTAAGLIAEAAQRGVPLDVASAASVIATTMRYARAPERSDRAGSDLSGEAHRSIWTPLIAQAGPYEPPLVNAIYATMIASESWRPYPDALPVVQELVARGVPVGVLSNIAWDIRPSLARAGLLELLHTVVLSYEVGYEKPDPALFTLACERMGHAPGDVLYVGDDPARDGPAVRIGMPVYLLPDARDVRRARG